MLWRLALLVIFAMFLAWYRPSPEQAPVLPPAREPALPVLSEHQIVERAGQCEQASRGAFRREWQEGAVDAAGGPITADFKNHYDAKLDTCFYLLIVKRSGTLSKKLYDADTRELYGEYLGAAAIEPPPASQPKTCRVESLYCASEGEWDVLVTSYLRD